MATDKAIELAACDALSNQIEKDVSRVLSGDNELNIWNNGSVYITFKDDDLGDDAWERVYYERVRGTTSIRRVYDYSIDSSGVHEHTETTYQAVMGLNDVRTLFKRTLKHLQWKTEEALKRG
jgi:hypothetical protein